MIETSRFLVSPGEPARLETRDPHSKSGFEGGKKTGKAALAASRKRLADLQNRLWAQSSQSLLVVLQAIDTGGKDGTIKHVFTGVNPQGVHVRGFGVPSERERAHDYLWRIHRETPEDGAIAIFNRSHYEDVLVVRVKDLVPEEVWRRRYRHIAEFERMLTDEGTTVVKLFLHISKDEQRERLQARLDEPDKRWKFSRGDLDDRRLWDRYTDAFEEAITRTSTDYAPWYVIPADRKWYRNLVVSQILTETLDRMAPTYPEPDQDVDILVVE
jgi:PPK2 family polyphosphate:nucleotide phosphotransferase